MRIIVRDSDIDGGRGDIGCHTSSRSQINGRWQVNTSGQQDNDRSIFFDETQEGVMLLLPSSMCIVYDWNSVNEHKGLQTSDVC